MFDDRLTIYSPGGMPDGTLIQNRDISTVSSTRRNPVLADIFGRLGYMERQGSGLNKIRDAYENAANFRAGMEPAFYSDRTQFTVTLPNLNYHTANHQVAIPKKHIAVEVAIDVVIDELNITASTKAKIRSIFNYVGYDTPFGRKDIAGIIGISQTAAGNLINKLKTADVIESVSGLGKGKYKFKKAK